MRNIVLVVFLSLIALSASAGGIGLSKSRIIFSAAEKNQTVDINNGSDKPYLIQTSVIQSPEGQPTELFIVTPPLFRLNANSDYTVRIIPKNISELPGDKESLFYLKVRAIPALNTNKRDHPGADLVFVTSVIIKLHYRPGKLPVPDQSVFEKTTLVKNNQGWNIYNPTPYYLTVTDLTVNHHQQPGSILIPPSGLKKIDSPANIQQASWQVINDYGSRSDSIHFQSSGQKNNMTATPE
ncbi:molecular chaperone [Morganella psychrotolerans]|uniref:fimbrial biogenesis chaperone n=1 Tax=Morganella psychrotolerans TaxID=368603 RepID=UPI0039B0091E